MPRLAAFFLYLIHAAYALVGLASSLREHLSFARRREPQKLTAQRKQLPGHIALLLTCDDAQVAETEQFGQQLIANVENVVAWCRATGIQRLTLYDRKGVLSRLSFELRARLSDAASRTGCAPDEEEGSEPEYPLTPPLSDDSPSRSRSLSPDSDISLKLHVSTLKLGEKPRARKRRTSGVALKRRAQKATEVGETIQAPVTIHILSRDSGKPALAQVANSLLREHRHRYAQPKSFSLSVNELKSFTEGENGFPSPDLMLVHPLTRPGRLKDVLELHGFPPWQVSLTEFHYDLYPRAWWSWSRFSRGATAYIPLTESDFCRALDVYASAEMRNGK